MKSFKQRYNAYIKAERLASRYATVLSYLFMIICFIPLYFVINLFIEARLLKIIGIVITLLVLCGIGGICDYKLKQTLLKLFFKRELQKLK